MKILCIISDIMNLKKYKPSSVLSLICLMIMIGMNLAPITAANITVNSGLKSSEIQKLIDNSKAGDTLNFQGGSYNNVSLVINKKLNIKTTNKTVLNGYNTSNTAGGSTYVFYFNKSSSGSQLSGFNINTDSDFAIILNNVKNIKLYSNTLNGGKKAGVWVENSNSINLTGNVISNSKGNGVFIDSSKHIILKNNHVTNNVFSGINITGSEDVKISLNKVLNNFISGLTIYFSNNVLVLNNSFEQDGHGTYLSNTKNINIIGNNISNNRLNGITMEDVTEDTLISRNYIISNLNGIYLDSFSINDSIILNVIKNSVKTVYTEYDVEYTGDGIIAGDNYQETGIDSLNIKIHDNAIINNNYNVKGNAKYDKFVVGANWYGTNDRWKIHVCPMVDTGMLMSDNITGYIGTDISSNNGTSSGNGTDNGKGNNQGNGTSNGNGNSSQSGGSVNGNGKGSTTTNGTVTGSGQDTTQIGVDGSSSNVGGSNSEGGNSGGGIKAVEVAIKNGVNSAYNNPWTNIGIIALLGLIGLGYFKRDKLK